MAHGPQNTLLKGLMNACVVSHFIWPTCIQLIIFSKPVGGENLDEIGSSEPEWASPTPI